MFLRNENFKQYTRAYPVVSILLAINLVVFIITLIPIIGDKAFYTGLSHNYSIKNGEWWRLITSMFLHADFMHLLMNMFSLFVFAPELEKFVGKWKFLAIYLVSGLAGGILTFITQDLSYASVGASGAIFGVFGAYGAILIRYKHLVPQLRQIILPIIVISVIMTFLSPGINVTAHLGGMATGFVLGLYFFKPKLTIVNRR